jgi:hypothetical protein
MPANSDPIYTKNGRIGSVLVTAANTSSAGGGTINTDIFLVLTADATNGSFISRVRLIPVATAATSTTATVARIFLSTQSSGATTNANTFLWAEQTLPVVAADNASAAVIWYDIPFGFVIPAGYNILVTNHAAPAANTNWRALALGGDY